MSSPGFTRFIYRMLSLCIFLYTGQVFAQDNVFYFPEKPKLQEHSTFTCLYRIPQDSVYRYAYSGITPDTKATWMQHPAYIIPFGKTDSFMRTPVVLPGNYISVEASQNNILLQPRHREGFRVFIHDLGQDKLLTILDLMNQPVKNAIVTGGKAEVAYNETLQGYLLSSFKNGEQISVQHNNDIQFLQCNVNANRAYNNTGRGNEALNAKAESKEFNGYLVTNKPKYLPGDTVKFKAYLQFPKNNKPATEPVTVSFGDGYNAHEYIMFAHLSPEEPGVYFSEFVLGDSIKSSRQYELEVQGTHSNYRLTQIFTVEDYLLDQMHLRVTGEQLPFYQQGDSVHLYAAAFTSNNLPVLDGELTITVLPNSFDTRQKQSLFIPDTLYHTTAAVNPDGETYLGFSTGTFPPLNIDMRCIISLRNSNFEQHDTTIYMGYKITPAYLSLSSTKDTAYAKLIRNKKSVTGKGYYYINGDISKRTYITFPFSYHMVATDQQISFAALNDADSAYDYGNVYINDDGLQGIDDYIADTAYLRLINPQKKLFRYYVYIGNKLKGQGITAGDTLIKVHTVKNRTVTIIGSYLWRGETVSRRFDIYKMNRNMQISMHKKDLIFPGQTDTIGINLSNKDNQSIPHTNVTVLAFNSQFTEDHVPDLPYSGMLKPAYTARVISSVSPVSMRSVSASIAKDWLHACGADTVFLYQNLFLLPDDIAWLSYPVPGSVMPQLAIYLKSGASYIVPEVIYVDEKPVYYRYAKSTNPQGLFVPEGVHSLRLRTMNTEYYVSQLQLCAGEKTNLFINTDSVGPFITRDTIDRHTVKITGYNNHLSTIVTKNNMPDSLTYNEINYLGRSFLLYRNEYRNLQDIRLEQFPVQINLTPNYTYTWPGRYDDNAISLIGPFSFTDSMNFFQYSNTALRFMPELNYIFSFRPFMTRVEKWAVEQYLHQHLSADIHWPEYGYVAPNPENFDTLKVQPAVAQIQYNDDLHRTKTQYLIIPRGQSGTANTSVVFPKFTDSLIKYIILRNEQDTGSLLIKRFYYNETLRITAGRYTVQVIWSNDSTSVTGPIVIKPLGTNIIPLFEPRTKQLFSYEHPPAWIKKQVIEDSDHAERMAVEVGRNEIYGTVLDAQKQPAIGAVIRVLQEGVNKGAAATDIDGNYSIRPLAGGSYTVKISYAGSESVTVQEVIVTDGHATRLNFNLEENNGTTLKSVVITYRRPLVSPESPGGNTHLERTQVNRMPTRNTSDFASESVSAYRGNNYSVSLGGARAEGTQYIIDGVQVSGSAAIDRAPQIIEDQDLPQGKSYLKSAGTQSFINNFISNMMQASGLRKSFRDWAIWEPNLWTDNDGNTSFHVTYPDNNTSWKTYVLAMNRKGYAAKTMSITRAFKPLSAELSVPRFLRYGDTLIAIGKVANYTGQPFQMTAGFTRDTTILTSDTMLVHNSRVKETSIAAPLVNSTDTAQLPLSFSIHTQNGFTDGEERTLPVFPVGTVETKGLFACLNGDSSISSTPDASQGYFTGRVRVQVDASLLEAMLREIEHLEIDPHGCTEQLTTKLQAIYYEEVIKGALKNEKPNNAVAKKKILEQLLKAQNYDGSFGWWSYNSSDYRITNYVVSTLYKINKDGWLDYVVRQGLRNLNNNVSVMNTNDQIASLSTLSVANFPANYKTTLDHIDKKTLNTYNRFAVIKIKKEQGLPYRKDLDTLMSEAKRNQFGIYWSNNNYYDWYRDETATSLLAYQVVKDDSIYGRNKQDIINYVLFKKQYGYYANTATSGLVLSTLLPDLLKDLQSGDRKKPTQVVLSGSIQDSLTVFPKSYTLKNMHPDIHFNKKGISPVYVSVSYDYLNLQPKAHDSVFKVSTVLLHNGDTITSLKQGEKVTLRTTVTCRRVADYVMIEIPIPAGCVPVSNNNYYPSWPESARETFKDRIDIFCGNLDVRQYTFDVPLEVRYKGSFSMNPARACMMYYPEEYGNTELKKIAIH